MARPLSASQVNELAQQLSQLTHDVHRKNTDAREQLCNYEDLLGIADDSTESRSVSRDLKAAFDEDHQAGVESLKAGDYNAFGEAIHRETKLIDQQAELIEREAERIREHLERNPPPKQGE